MNKLNKEYYSTLEVAKLLGISRVAMFYKIKSGEIPAHKFGRGYFIAKKHLENLLDNGDTLTDQKKKEIEESIKKTVKEYGETLDLLGKGAE